MCVHMRMYHKTCGCHDNTTTWVVPCGDEDEPGHKCTWVIRPGKEIPWDLQHCCSTECCDRERRNDESSIRNMYALNQDARPSQLQALNAAAHLIRKKHSDCERQIREKQEMLDNGDLKYVISYEMQPPAPPRSGTGIRSTRGQDSQGSVQSGYVSQNQVPSSLENRPSMMRSSTQSDRQSSSQLGPSSNQRDDRSTAGQSSTQSSSRAPGRTTTQPAEHPASNASQSTVAGHKKSAKSTTKTSSEADGKKASSLLLRKTGDGGGASHH